MKNIQNVLTFVFFLITSLSFAQGTVSGTVMDGEFNEPMAFANILVKGTTTGVSADFDGKYELELEEGTYTLVFSFVGYVSQEITGVVIKNNEVTTLDIVLQTNSLDAVIITTTTKRNTENSVLNLQKKSVVVLDGLSAQAIKSSGASNVASAVKSVPGVSIQGGKYVYVRGLGDRYTKSILNGIDIPGLDPDRNTIQMDLFPTNILDNVIVLKSASAEYPADFTGGIVNIVTKDFPSKAEYTLSLGMGYNPDMHFNNNYLTSGGSDTDFFGFDDGTRDLPIHRYQPIPGTFENKLLLTTLTDRFSKELRAKQEASGMNFDLGFTLGNQYDLGDDKIGYQASFSYKNETTFYENREDGAFVKNNSDSSDNNLNFTLASKGSEGINNVILNGMLGLTYKTGLSKFKANLLHIQNGESGAGFYNQVISQDGVGGGLEPLTKNAITYTERSVTNLLLSGIHRLSDNENAFNLEWKFSPTFSKVMDKNHRITPLQQADNGDSFISPSASTYPIQLWRNLIEESWSGKVDLDKTIELFGRPAKLKFGGAYTYKFRDFSIDDYTFNIQGDDAFIASGDVDQLLNSNNIWNPDTDNGTFLVFGDQFNPNDAYEGEQGIAATYFSAEFNLSENFKTVLGLRTEKFNSFYTGQNNTIVYNRESILDEFDFFPSANIIYSLNDKSNVRTSYSRTTARPSFKEASVAQIFDPITNRLFIGNIDLVPTYVNNFDLRYEHFGENGQMFAVSGFYKDFTDPIEQSFFLQAPTQLTVDNLGNATVYGVEFELRQRLGFISEGLNNLKFNANVSLIKSELTMSDDEFESRSLAARDGETIERERDLQGQAPYLINVGLDYNNSDIGLQTGLFYNIQGSTLEVVGIGLVPDVYTQPFNSLNFTLNKSFGESKNSSIDLKITNILGSERLSEYESYKTENQTFSLRDPGTEISLGYSFKF
ncbi:TonB-dependent receptor [Winogradskyella echinorum]|uniref:TonB-dependent receptor n=1 Tax=Winogradskyella echinorum TaxID=538189 RepID=A0ABR6XZW2_9FLAO|nr:TonB-dependent receptor [Winogradskyella echinorum]MBC3846040.1 TonB-dependent receptor [Winogradskyella echinorum]MBC5750388.1 TonB-dependent receptor [Winogradskyella echinorum]